MTSSDPKGNGTEQEESVPSAQKEAEAESNQTPQKGIDPLTRYMRNSSPKVRAAFRKWAEEVDALGYSADYHFGASHGFEAGVDWARRNSGR